MKDGILIIDKPKNYTSHDIVAKCRKVLNTKRIGHTGTLDPLATGVLVLCIDSATKLVEYLTCNDKVYDVEMKFGIKTNTGDISGTILQADDKEIPIPINEKFWKTFIGKQEQVPPMYSAIKKDGVKLYELARKGIEVERESRDIEIFNISNVSQVDNIVRFRVHCSKGTYIRVLCEDIAKRLGTIGTMTSLRRIQSGEFHIADAVPWEEIEEKRIIPIEKVLKESLDIKEIDKIMNGIALPCEKPDGLYNLYLDGQFVGIGEVKGKLLKRKIMIEK